MKNEDELARRIVYDPLTPAYRHYIAIYETDNPTTAKAQVKHVKKRDSFKERVTHWKEVREEEQRRGGQMDKARLLEVTQEIICNDGEKAADRLKAIALYAELTGQREAPKVEHTVTISEQLIEALRQREAPKVVQPAILELEASK